MANLAAGQFGLITRAQLLAAGLGSSTSALSVQRGELERLHGGVYRVAGAPPSWRQRAMAALLYCGPDAVLSHATAAHLHRLDGFERAPAVLDVMIPRARKRTLEGVRVHRFRAQARPSSRSGLPVTQLAPTLIDLADVLDPLALELALDAAGRQVKDLGAWLGRLLEGQRCVGRIGVKTLRALLAERLGQATESPVEVEVWRALRRSHLPAPERQVTLSDEAGAIMRVDFAWPARRVVLHADSVRWHQAAARMTRDAEQRRRLAVQGWRQMAVMRRTLNDERWLADLERLLEPQLPLGAGLACLEQAARPVVTAAADPNLPRDPAPQAHQLTKLRPGASQLQLTFSAQPPPPAFPP